MEGETRPEVKGTVSLSFFFFGGHDFVESESSLCHYHENYEILFNI